MENNMSKTKSTCVKMDTLIQELNTYVDAGNTSEAIQTCSQLYSKTRVLFSQLTGEKLPPHHEARQCTMCQKIKYLESAPTYYLDNMPCFKCGETGHWAASCPRRADLSHISCFACQEKGHYANKCPNKREQATCWTCNEKGHYATSCPKKNLQKLKPIAFSNAQSTAVNAGDLTYRPSDASNPLTIDVSINPLSEVRGEKAPRENPEVSLNPLPTTPKKPTLPYSPASPVKAEKKSKWENGDWEQLWKNTDKTGIHGSAPSKKRRLKKLFVEDSQSKTKHAKLQ